MDQRKCSVGVRSNYLPSLFTALSLCGVGNFALVSHIRRNCLRHKCTGSVVGVSALVVLSIEAVWLPHHSIKPRMFNSPEYIGDSHIINVALMGFEGCIK